MATYAFPLPGWQGPIQLHHGSHIGAVDLMAPRGQAIVSMTTGVVTSTSSGSLGGNTVTIEGDDGLEYYYAHMDGKPLVKNGDRVMPGSRLGAVGNTGNAESTPPHLHLGIGYGIISGAGPSGGAGRNFNAVEMLKKIYAGQAPDVKPGDKVTDVGFFDPVDSITDAGTGALVSLLTSILGAFSNILRGKA